jgi:alpha-tubulin suppressor-like RCC1 family protein
MSRDNWPEVRERYSQLRKEQTMLYNSSYQSVVTRFIKKHLVTSTLALVFAIVATPAISHAATSWYSQGSSHTLVFAEDGKVWAVGANNYGQLGNGTFGGESLEPTMVKGLDNVVAVLAGGSHSVALKKDGTVWAWGYNGSGQLGNGTKEPSAIPQKVSGISNVKAIATGANHIVALKNDGTVLAWGDNLSGQGGIAGADKFMTPTPVPGLHDIAAIASSKFTTFALKSDGSVWAWGYNGNGQLGNDEHGNSKSPVQVFGLNNIRAIAAGNSHIAAVKQDGTVWAWGSNRASQLGTTEVAYSYSPMQVAGLSNIIDITASAGHTIAIAKNDAVLGWGDTGTGQWGNGASLNGNVSPVQVSGYNGPVEVAALVNPNSVLRGTEDSMVADANTTSQGSFITASR